MHPQGSAGDAVQRRAGEITLCSLTQPIARGAGTRCPNMVSVACSAGQEFLARMEAVGMESSLCSASFAPKTPRRGERMGSQQAAKHGEDLSRLHAEQLWQSTPQQLLFVVLLNRT